MTWLLIIFYLCFSVFENPVVVIDDSPLLHLIDDMPLVRPDDDLMEFSVDDDGDLINFSNKTTHACIDLFGKLDLSQSFSWLFGSNNAMNVDDIVTSFDGLNFDDDNIGACADSSDFDREKQPATFSFGNLSPLKNSGTDFSYECKRLFGHLDKVRRQLDFDDVDGDDD